MDFICRKKVYEKLDLFLEYFYRKPIPVFYFILNRTSRCVTTNDCFYRKKIKCFSPMYFDKFLSLIKIGKCLL